MESNDVKKTEDGKRTGIWEESDYEKAVPASAVWIYGPKARYQESPLAICYDDEILVPSGIKFEIEIELGAVRIRFIAKDSAITEAEEEAEALATAARDQAENRAFDHQAFKEGSTRY